MRIIYEAGEIALSQKVRAIAIEDGEKKEQFLDKHCL